MTLANPVESRFFSSIGTSFFSGTANTALTTLVTPAANVNGLNVYNSEGNNGAGLCSLLAKTTTPVSWIDGHIIADMHTSPAHIGTPVFIPAGYGLYLRTSAASGNYFITYDIL